MKRSAKRIEFLNYILSTAVEGGINDWSAVSEYRCDDDDIEWSVKVHVFEPDEGEMDDNGYAEEGILVTIDTIAKGIGVIKAMDYQPNYFGDGGAYWRQFLLADRTNGDDGDYDAIIADWIVQAGIFGEIVYG